MSGPPPANLPDSYGGHRPNGRTISLKHNFASPRKRAKCRENCQEPQELPARTALSLTEVSGFQWGTPGFASQISSFQPM